MRFFPAIFPKLLAGVCLLAPSVATAQSWGQVVGRVSVPGDEPVPGATVLVERTAYGTSADADGRFALRLPTGRYRLRISAIGYAPVYDSVTVRRERPTLLNVRLRPTDAEGEGVEVTARAEGAGVFELQPEDVTNLPAPFRSVFQAVRVLPGVAANNEISNQFSVRGGGVSENLLFLNGYEVYLPFRPKQGEQEGLGLMNPDLSASLTLYAGGFPARYGGKLSSALDVRYHAPEAGDDWHGAVGVSTLDAGAAVWGPVGRAGVAVGVRRAQAGRLFGTQATQGRYAPEFTDAQAAVTIPIGTKGVRVEAIGAAVRHAFALEPRSRKTYFGFISQNQSVPSNFQSLFTRYTGEETSGFDTYFGGLRLVTPVGQRLRMEHDVSVFDTDEYEKTNLSGTALLAQVDPGNGDEYPLGTFESFERADNRIRVQTLTGQGRYGLAVGQHALEAGWSARRLNFDDRLNESSGYRNDEKGTVLSDTLRDAATLDALQAGGYLQDAFGLFPSHPERAVLTAGVRLDYFDFNDETTVSPRLGLRYKASAVTTVNASAGVYYQPPTYQELRGVPKQGETILGALNRDLRAQRSVQGVVGVEHFFNQTRLWLRAEAYAKKLDRIISYSVDNVQVQYSGENDAHGRVLGFDVQVRGEFVPGLESWFNYGFLHATETFEEPFVTLLNAGERFRPTDQRHTASLFVQDYIPGDQTWRLHLRGLYGSGYPFTPLRITSATIGGQQFMVPGPRNSARYDSYKRVDIGASKEITFTRRGRSSALLSVTAEILNVFDMTNEVAINYTSTGAKFNREPIRLTPRTFNLRARFSF